MNLLQMQTEILGYMGDPDGDYSTPAEVTTALNQAQDIVAQQLLPLAVFDLCPKLISPWTDTTDTGAETYPIPSDYMGLVRFSYGTANARIVTPPERSAVDGSNTWTKAVAADPAVTVEGAYFHVFPTPTDSATALAGVYVKQPTRLSAPTDVSDFGIQFDHILIELATGIRFSKVGAWLENADQESVNWTNKGMASIGALNAKYGKRA